MHEFEAVSLSISSHKSRLIKLLFSAQQLENRLDRIWKQKQKDKDERMRKIRKIHEKEIRALEWKCSVKNERLYGRPPDRRRAEFRATLGKVMQQESEQEQEQNFDNIFIEGKVLNDQMSN